MVQEWLKSLGNESGTFFGVAHGTVFGTKKSAFGTKILATDGFATMVTEGLLVLRDDVYGCQSQQATD